MSNIGYSPSDVLLAAIKGGLDEELAHDLADYVREVQIDAKYDLYKSHIWNKNTNSSIKENPISKDEFRNLVKESREHELFLEV